METSLPDDPWRWSVDNVVQALCHRPETWTAITPDRPSLDLAALESALRGDEVNGMTLLEMVDQDVVRQEWGITRLAQRGIILKLIRRLRAQSAGYHASVSLDQSFVTEVPGKSELAAVKIEAIPAQPGMNQSATSWPTAQTPNASDSQNREAIASATSSRSGKGLPSVSEKAFFSQSKSQSLPPQLESGNGASGSKVDLLGRKRTCHSDQPHQSDEFATAMLVDSDEPDVQRNVHSSGISDSSRRSLSRASQGGNVENVRTHKEKATDVASGIIITGSQRHQDVSQSGKKRRRLNLTTVSNEPFRSRTGMLI